ncbi:MAG: hypothetical protein JNK15_20415 [Planctomycetes bacterium]|nr:hypothetical protein [Planctomycetota bacterium]
MIEIHEADLIEFFGVAPEPEPPEEREFFDAPLFIKRVDGIELRVRIPCYFRLLWLDLRKANDSAPALDLVIPGIVAIRIDRSQRHPILTVTSSTHGVVTIAVEPAIQVHIDGSAVAGR